MPEDTGSSTYEPYHRRRRDVQPDDSLIRRAAKNPLVEKLLYALATVIIGGTASVATHRVKDAEEIAVHEANRAHILKVEAELADLRAKMYQRVRQEEEARERFVEQTRDRLTVVETKLGMH